MRSKSGFCDAFDLAVEESADWIVYLDLSDMWHHWSVAVDAAAAYDGIRKHLDAETRATVDDFARLLFWETKPIGINDLGCNPKNPNEMESFAINASPETVAAKAVQGRKVEAVLDRLRSPFDATSRHEKSWMQSFDEFRDYVLTWVNIFKTAAKKGYGIVITIA